ncbi:MAG: ABC transporter permease [Gammaproteobacteria bacterium]|nr:ABC transporter permease [Gammaproteobacteria bacterium]
MNTILNRAGRNFLLRHPWQLALALLGITLGVAVVIAIDLALDSALQSFKQAERTVSGKATHRIAGSEGGLDEMLYRKLRVEHGTRNLAPVLQTYLPIQQNPEIKLRVIGIDPFAENAFRSGWQNGQDSAQAAIRLVAEANTAMLGRHTAEALELDIDDELIVTTGTGDHRLRIVDLISPGSAAATEALRNIVIADISTVQEITGWFGKLSYIDAIIPENDTRNVQSRLADLLPGDVSLVSIETQFESMQQMTEAFSINLSAMGLLSLLVGMFLIYNTMTFLVLQRRGLIGNLRLIGVTRRQISRMILTEALMLAVIGTALGIGLGLLLGQIMLHPVSATVDTLYFKIDAMALSVSPLQIGKAVLLGVGATLLAAIPPLREANRFSPKHALTRSQLESGTRRLTRSVLLLGLLLIAVGFAVGFMSETSIQLGLASVFLLLFGFALLTPSATLVIMSAVETLSGRHFGILGKLPPRMVGAEISRTGVAIAALMIAVAATIGMNLMIDSFRVTVSQWLNTTLQADLYVSIAGDKPARDKAFKDRRLKAIIAELAEVDQVSTVLHTLIAAGGMPVKVSAFELTEASKNGFVFKQAFDTGLWRAFEEQQTVIVTEPYAYHNKVKAGDTIALQTAKGLQDFKILGVYYDYSGDRGRLAMSRTQYLRYWPDLGYTGIGVYGLAGSDLNVLESRLRDSLPQALDLKSSRAIFDASMQVFNETFLITETLRWLAAGIAFVGVFGALMALQFERTRQLGILRAIGMTPRQLTGLIYTETGLMGLTAGLIAVPVGLFVAYVLIHIVYLRSFGWTMAFYVDPAVLVQGLLLAVFAALLAGILPAYRMARTRPAEALRAE